MFSYAPEEQDVYSPRCFSIPFAPLGARCSGQLQLDVANLKPRFWERWL